MNQMDIGAGALQEAEQAGANLARVALLRREFGAIMKMDAVLRSMLDAEESLGMDVCSMHFEDCLWKLQSAIKATARELARMGGAA